MTEGWVVAFGIVLGVVVAAMAYDVGRHSAKNDCQDYGRFKAGTTLVVCQVQK